jgi:hypothetical protein
MSKGLLASKKTVCTFYQFRKFSAFVGATTDPHDIKIILAAEGYWDLRTKRPSLAGLQHSVKGTRGNIFLWDKDFMQSLLRRYAMRGDIALMVNDYARTYIKTRALFFDQKDNYEEFQASGDLLNIAGEEIKTQLTIWGINKKTSFTDNLWRVNKWIRYKTALVVKTGMNPGIREFAKEPKLSYKQMFGA